MASTKTIFDSLGAYRVTRWGHIYGSRLAALAAFIDWLN